MAERNPILDHVDYWDDILYKYKPFSGFGMRLAAYGEIYFASGDNLNDPFEGYFVPESKVFTMSDSELRRHAKEMVKLHDPNADPRAKPVLEEMAFKRSQLLRDDPFAHIQDMMTVQRRNLGILSLTRRPDSAAMWAYYAENHTGLCIGLRTESIGEFQMELLQQKQLVSLYEASYVEEVPKMNVDSQKFSQSEFDEMARTFYTKSPDWQHEKEVRLVYLGQAGHTFQLGPQAVAEVIVGDNAEPVLVDSLKSLLENTGSPATMLRAVRKKHQYGFDFEEIV